MRTKTLALLGLLGLVTVAFGGKDDAPAKQYWMKMSIIEIRDGKPVTVAEPMLLSHDGKPASFLAGGERPVELGKIEYVEFGTRAMISAHELPDGQLRVSAAFNVSKVEKSPDGTITIPETGVRVIKTITPGEAIETKLPDGRQIKLTVRPAK